MKIENYLPFGAMVVFLLGAIAGVAIRAIAKRHFEYPRKKKETPCCPSCGSGFTREIAEWDASSSDDASNFATITENTCDVCHRSFWL